MVFIMSEGVVERWVQSAKAEMERNGKREIRCPCRRCKLKCLIKPESGDLESHLLIRGFMDGYTQWVVSDEEFYGAARTINEEEGHDGPEYEESPRHDYEDAGGDYEYS